MKHSLLALWTVVGICECFSAHPFTPPQQQTFSSQFITPNQYVNGWYQPHRYQGNKGSHHVRTRSIYVPDQMKSNHVMGTRHPTWSFWSKWTSCSKTCAGGVTSRTRVCKSEETPLRFNYEENTTSEEEQGGGRGASKKCAGKPREVVACNTQPCLNGHTLRLMKRIARSRQCSAYNKIPYRGDKYNWVPYLKKDADCELNCMPRKSRFFKTFGNVADGTICGKAGGFHCVKGKCVRRREEATKRQAVGRTRNTTPKHTSRSQQTTQRPKQRFSYIIKPMVVPIQWKKVSRTFHTSRYATNLEASIKAFLIPIKAVNVTIAEIYSSSSKIVLKASRHRALINGRSLVQESRKMYFDGSIIDYNSGDNNGGREKITISGPLRRNFYIDILKNGSLTDILYEYSIPTKNMNYVREVARRRQYNPIRYQQQHFPAYQQNYVTNAGLNHQGKVPLPVGKVPPYHGANNRRIPFNGNQQRRFNNNPFPPRVTFPLNRPVNARVVPPFVPNANTNTHFNGNFNTFGNNRVIGGTRGPINNNVQNIPFNHRWFISGFTNCTKKCGGGEQEMVFRCFEARGGGSNGRFVEDAKCKEGEKPAVRRRMCNVQPCPYEWKTSRWSDCSKRCGIDAVKTRRVRCSRVTHVAGRTHDETVKDELCERTDKPESEMKCPFKPCNYRWHFDEWSECSKKCDYGMQHRDVHCRHVAGFRLPNRYCDVKYQPNGTRNCMMRYCSVGWFASQWNECSSQCGEGIQTRHVVCSSSTGDVLDERKCRGQQKLVTQRACNGKVCKEGVWLSTEWTKCSTSCGMGKQFRSAFCLVQNDQGVNQVVSDVFCRTKTKPTLMKRCYEKECKPMWHTNAWSQCNCTLGTQTRHQICMTSENRKARGCEWSSRPDMSRDCSQKCGKKENTERKSKNLLERKSTVVQEGKPAHSKQPARKNNVRLSSRVDTQPRRKITKAATTTTTGPTTTTNEPITTAASTRKKTTTTLKTTSSTTTTTTTPSTTTTTPSTTTTTPSTTTNTRQTTSTTPSTTTTIRQTTTTTPTTTTTTTTTPTRTTTTSTTRKTTKATVNNNIASQRKRLQSTNGQQPKNPYNWYKQRYRSRIAQLRRSRLAASQSRYGNARSRYGRKQQSSSTDTQCLDTQKPGFCHVVKKNGFCVKPRLKKYCCVTCTKG
uniref:PLAC domain-containing protein n=2 Tax=Clytia hemisphaerica TaxID=252671 RepID=A0A7M5UY93_9CNID